MTDFIRNFFTHKDFLPTREQLPGSLFTPLHFAFAAICLVLVITLAVSLYMLCLLPHLDGERCGLPRADTFAGFHTFIFHGSMLFCALVMMLSGYHRPTKITEWYKPLLPTIPFLIVSVFANIVNFSKIDSDYMFFKLESFIFAPIGAATPDWLSVLIVYVLYILIQSLPYLPSLIKNRAKIKNFKTEVVAL